MDDSETNNKQLINENAICTLKLSRDSKSVIVDFVPIEKILDVEFSSIIHLIQSKDTIAYNILSLIKNNEKLRVLLSVFDYCRELGCAYEGINLSISDIETRYQKSFNHIEDDKKKYFAIDAEKKDLNEAMQHRLLAYYLEQSYLECEREIKRGNIIAYSHRKRGWKSPIYKIGKYFSFEFATNFGYGKVSYFHTLIYYKGLPIIPFTEWINYRYAKIYEILSYSQNHKLENGSWLDAMQYVKGAYDLAASDEDGFIKQYIIKDCGDMVEGLENILVNDHYEFIGYSFFDKRKSYKSLEEEGHNINEFRGEKISGSLKFIEIISRFEEILDMRDYIKRIEDCNRKVQPILIKEIRQITNKLTKLNDELPQITTKLEQLEIQKKEYSELKSKLWEGFNSSNESKTYSELNTIFDARYPEYHNIMECFYDVQIKYDGLRRGIHDLEITKECILSYLDEIRDYFGQKE